MWHQSPAGTRGRGVTRGDCWIGRDTDLGRGDFAKAVSAPERVVLIDWQQCSQLGGLTMTRGRLNTIAGSRLLSGQYDPEMRAAPTDASKSGSERYVARSLGNGQWCVWDTRCNDSVFETEGLSEAQALETARRLSQAYRRASKASRRSHET